MTSQVVQGTWLNKGGYRRFRGLCVKVVILDDKNDKNSFFQLTSKFVLAELKLKYAFLCFVLYVQSMRPVYLLQTINYNNPAVRTWSSNIRFFFFFRVIISFFFGVVTCPKQILVANFRCTAWVRFLSDRQYYILYPEGRGNNGGV